MAENTTKISLVTFDSYEKDIQRTFTEANNMVSGLVGDFYFMSRMAYRQKLDSACISVAYGGLMLNNKTKTDLKASQTVLTSVLEDVRKDIIRNEIDVVNYEELTSRIVDDMDVLISKTDKRMTRAKMLIGFGRKQSIAKVAFTLAELLEQRYSLIQSRFNELRRLIIMFMDSIKRELQYICRMGENAIAYERKGMKENELAYESDKELDLNLIDPTEMMKKTNTKKKKMVTRNNVFDNEDEQELTEEGDENLFLDDETNNLFSEENEQEPTNRRRDFLEFGDSTFATIADVFCEESDDEKLEDDHDVNENITILNDKDFDYQSRKKMKNHIEHITKGRSNKVKSPLMQRFKATKKIKMHKSKLALLLDAMKRQHATNNGKNKHTYF